MLRSTFGALLVALAFCSSAFGQTTPQFSLVDLGPITVAGSGLPWQAIQATPNTSIPSEASSQGAACYGTTTEKQGRFEPPASCATKWSASASESR